MDKDDYDETKMLEISLDEKKPLMQEESPRNPKEAGSGASPLDGFFKRIEELQQEINYFNSLSDQIQKIRGKELEEGAINQKSQVTKDNIDTQISHIKTKLYELITYSNQTRVEPGDHQIRKMQVEALKKRFLKQLEDFQKAEKKFKDDLKSKVVRQLSIANPEASQEEITSAIENNDTTFFSQAVIKSTRKAEGEQALQEVKERHQDLVKLEQSILKLSQLYAELQEKVELQDPLLFNIEDKVEDTNNNMEVVHEELGLATEHAKNARKKKIFLFILGNSVLIALLAGLAVFLFFQFSPRK